MRDAVREFVSQAWSPWHYVGLGFAVGLILVGWRVTLVVVGLLVALYLLGWLARRVLLLLTEGPDA